MEQRIVRPDSVPYYYHIHVHMPCNQRCIMCMPEGNHSGESLPFDHFVKFFDQIKAHAEHITLIGGEPLLYPHILPALELLADHKIAVTINTNLTQLDDTLIQRLLSLHELSLKCSIDAVSRDMYRRIRGTDRFEIVTGNLREFAKASSKSPNIKQILVFVVMRENLSEVLPFVVFARELDAHRVEFHPVRHVRNWKADNRTGWVFDGNEQRCEAFADQYNDLMGQAAARCQLLGLDYETLHV